MQTKQSVLGQCVSEVLSVLHVHISPHGSLLTSPWLHTKSLVQGEKRSAIQVLLE